MVLVYLVALLTFFLFFMPCRELYRNRLSRKIPIEIGNLKNPISMDLYEKNFQGKISKYFVKLESLKLT